MSKKAPARCAASFKETHKGVWGNLPNKQNGTPNKCPVFSTFDGKRHCLLQNDPVTPRYRVSPVAFPLISQKFRLQMARTLYLFLN